MYNLQQIKHIKTIETKIAELLALPTIPTTLGKYKFDVKNRSKRSVNDCVKNKGIIFFIPHGVSIDIDIKLKSKIEMKIIFLKFFNL